MKKMTKAEKWNKKGMAMMAAVLFASSVLAACGSSGTGEESSKTESSTESGREISAENNTETADAGSLITVHVGNEYLDFMNEIKKDFEEESGITVEIVERETQDTLDTIQLDGAAGKGPDITLIPYDRIGQFASQGTIAEAVLPDDGSFSDTNIGQVSYEEKVYGSPAIIESIVMYYNKDLLDKAPATFRELEELARDSAYMDGDKTTAFLAPLNAPYIVYGLLAGYGGYVFGDEGTNPADIGLNNSGSVEAVEYAKTWFDRWPTGMLDIKTNGNLVMESFTGGKTAAIIAGPWDASSIKETGLNYGVAKIPVLNNGSEYKPFGGGKSWVISNYSVNKEAAQEFITYLCGDDVQKKMYELKNEVPANLRVQQEISRGDDELVKAVIEQYKNASPTPNIPEMSEYWSIEESMLFDAYKGDMTVTEALDNGVNTFKKTIETKYGEE